MPADRLLNVTVNFTGTQASDGSYSGTATYTQTHIDPPMGDIVASNGDIDLENIPYWLNYNWAIGINFTLNPSVTDRNGNAVDCTWANTVDQACAITGPGGGRANGMTASLGSAIQVSIANANNDREKGPTHERTYTYKLGVMLPSVNNHFISLDPQITNTGPTSPM